MIKKGFTLIELLVVVAIMGMMGVLSVGGYSSMKRGIEERGVLQTVEQFVQNAYLRSRIDRVPTAVYFWNETKRDDSSDEGSVVAFGRAVAVRRMGRVTRVEGSFLVDEFGDLRDSRHTDEEGKDEENSDYQKDVGFYLYKCDGNESGFHRSLVSQTTVLKEQPCVPMILTGSQYASHNGPTSQGISKDKIMAYGYYLRDKGGISWKAGDGYALAFAELDLPENYTFGSYTPNESEPVEEMRGSTNPIRFDPNQTPGSSSVQIYALRPNASGAPTSTKIASTQGAKAGN